MEQQDAAFWDAEYASGALGDPEAAVETETSAEVRAE